MCATQPCSSTRSSVAARLAITFGLAVGTFCLYYYVLAASLLHEPVAAGFLHGNALGFMGWFALITLLYVVGFESYGLPRARTVNVASEPEPLVAR